ncbi:MAG: hypothetical protein IPN34_15575 [Planctomycetes bacterium]|nr:hypothetical protein [Planctomycetota bacterium]
MIGAHLRKEARALRTTLLGTALIVPPLALASTVLARRSAALDAGDVRWIVGGALALAVAMLVPPLVSRERARSGALFLERVPNGLRVGVAAKWCSAFALLAFAGVVAALSFVLATVGAPELWKHLVFDRQLAAVLTAGGGLAFWLLMAACWLPRSALAVPGGLIAAGLLAWPFALGKATYVLPFLAGDLAWLGFSVALAASVAAFFGFTRGLRSGARGGSAFFWSVPALLCLTASLSAWQVRRDHELDHFALTDPEARIDSVLIDAQGKHAYLNYKRYQRLSYAGVLDLRTGAWEQLGGEGMHVVGSYRQDNPFTLSDTVMPAEIVGFVGVSCAPVVWMAAESRRELFVDHARFEKQPHFDPLHWASHELGSEVREERSRHSSLRWPDGRRVWLFGGALEVERPGEAPERIALSGEKPWAWWFDDDYSFWLMDAAGPSRRRGLFDLHRVKLYPDQATIAAESHTFACLASGWLYAVRKQGQLVWRRVDPESGIVQDASPMHPDDHLVRNLGGDRLLVQRGAAFEVVDLATQQREPVRVDALPNGARALRQRNRSPAGHPLFVVNGESEGMLVRYDAETQALVGSTAFPIEGKHEPLLCVGALDDASAYVLVGRRRIARVRFGSAEAEQLFPR